MMNETSSSALPPGSQSSGSFSTLYISLGLYFVMFVVAMAMFEAAVHFDMNRLFAPRSYARPKQIIKNQIKQRPYCLRWVQWALSITYSEMLEGIKGTGTRNNGWSGSNLRCNLDGIVLIKFCVLCLKVSILATVLCICVILPVNFTAERLPFKYDDSQIGEQTYNNTMNLNTYEQTTYANIPYLFTNTNTTWYRIDGLFTNAFTKESTGTTIRMLTILFVAVVLYTYTCGK